MTPPTVTITFDVGDPCEAAALNAALAALQGGVAMRDEPRQPQPSRDTDPEPLPTPEPAPELPAEFVTARPKRKLAPDAPDADWDGMVALVLSGESAREVANRFGVAAQRLHGKVMAARRFAPMKKIPSETTALEPQGDAPAGQPAAEAVGVGEPDADPAPEVSEQDRPAEAADAVAAGESPAVPSWDDLLDRGLTSREAAEIRGSTIKRAQHAAWERGRRWAPVDIVEAQAAAKQRASDNARSRWVECAEAGMTRAEAAAHLGLSVAAARFAARKYGISFATKAAGAPVQESAGPPALNAVPDMGIPMSEDAPGTTLQVDETPVSVAETAAEVADSAPPVTTQPSELVAPPEPEEDTGPLPWTKADDARLLRAAMGSNDLDDIADAVDRPADDVEDRLELLCPAPRNRTTIGAALRKLTGQTEPDWLTLCVRVERGEDLAAVAEGAGVDAGALRIRVARRAEKREAEAAKAALWTPENDFRLAQAIIGGAGGAQRAADAIGVTKEDALARWDELMPRKGYAEQGALMRRLRAQVEAASAA